MSILRERALLQPFRLGQIPLRNRVVLPAHTTNFGEKNMPTRRNADYLAARAAGGVGLIITEAIRVHPSSAGRHQSLGSFTDRSVPAFASLVDSVHDSGAKIFAQLMHIGRQAAGDATRTAAWGASPIPWARGAFVPHTMGIRDIRTLIAAFGAAARRMQSAGFDGIELHAGHGHLIQQFLSPVTNTRTDAYGGSAANRSRLLREVLEAVFLAAQSLPVGLRVSVDEFLSGGITPEASVELLGQIVPEWPIAYLHASHSAYQAGYSLSTQMADMHFGPTPFVEHASIIKAAFPDTPVLAVCRFDTLERAADVVDAGVADLVALARPHIADPELVNKAMAGDHDSVTSCLACNQACIGRVELNLPISCVVNPEVGEERAWRTIRELPPIAKARRVLVVGGGPAGMKAALAASRGGARVVLAEAHQELGGQVRLAARLRGRDRLALSTEELARDLERSSVEVRMGTRVTDALVADGAFDEVVIATGSRPYKRTWGPGVPVLDIHQAIEQIEQGAIRSDGTVVVVDGEGTWAAASLAEELAAAGQRVELVSPTPTLFARITTYTKGNLLHRLADLPVGLHLLHDIESTTADGVMLRNQVTGDLSPLTGVSAIVDIAPARADDELFHQLQEQGGLGIQVVGDANSPRSVLEAIYEGHRAGASLTRDPLAVDEALSGAV